MYFQKLESLKEHNKLLSLVIDALDYWLAYVPFAYKNKLYPELFAKAQDIPVKLSIELFGTLSELKILKERYSIECECGHILEICDTIDEVYNFVKLYNEEMQQCSFCDCYTLIDTDNVFRVYELIEKPQISEIIKKKDNLFGCNDSIKRKSLSENVLENPNKFGENELIKVIEIAPSAIRDKFKIFNI